jgi:hypothetical protein
VGAGAIRSGVMGEMNVDSGCDGSWKVLMSAVGRRFWAGKSTGVMPAVYVYEQGVVAKAWAS